MRVPVEIIPVVGHAFSFGSVAFYVEVDMPIGFTPDVNFTFAIQFGIGF